MDPYNDDFHLAGNSPCIDAGDNNASEIPDKNFEGDDRILDGNGDQLKVVDMGVDEYLKNGGALRPRHWQPPWHQFSSL
ncbi:MAG: hypothetical protein KJ645_04890 [Planctomycetes bacterium]|nr:hypothetical protein [Planctomycetota bacterium]